MRRELSWTNTSCDMSAWRIAAAARSAGADRSTHARVFSSSTDMACVARGRSDVGSTLRAAARCSRCAARSKRTTGSRSCSARCASSAVSHAWTNRPDTGLMACSTALTRCAEQPIRSPSACCVSPFARRRSRISAPSRAAWEAAGSSGFGGRPRGLSGMRADTTQVLDATLSVRSARAAGSQGARGRPGDGARRRSHHLPLRRPLIGARAPCCGAGCAASA